jgi:hypothetical protein
MELTGGSEISANYNLTPEKYPKEQIQKIKSILQQFYVMCRSDENVPLYCPVS